MSAILHDTGYFKRGNVAMKQYDEIRIQNLEVFANHGVFQEENQSGAVPVFLYHVYGYKKK